MVRNVKSLKSAVMLPILRRLHLPTKQYLASPIFYVNAAPHLGHAYTMLLCDAKHRWEKLNPRSESYLLTGTDEHGLKIQAVAEKKGYSNPQILVDEVSQNFKVLANKLDISYDRFMRTTDEDHIETVRKVWNIMDERGLIYKGSHSGWYSVSDETFYPETQIQKVEGKMVSIESRTEVIYHSETNYFFKMSQFQDSLIQYLEENPKFVQPQHKYDELLRELKTTTLGDLSISRPASRLQWSIEVPGDPTQKIYVWFDALTNYITGADFLNKFQYDPSTGTYNSEDSIWPATHVIGKDIIKFHCVYWPIFLMAMGVVPPKQVIVHSHWLCDGFKMSKSIGNVIDPIETSEYYGVDALRFFLMEYSNIENDCNYSEVAFSATRDTLIGKYANLMTRCGGAKFDIHESVKHQNEGTFKGIEEIILKDAIHQEKVPEILKLRTQVLEGLDTIYAAMNSRISRFEYMKAIQDWWKVVDSANLFFQTAEPWLYEKDHILQSYYVFLAAETCRISSILISPIIPNLSGKILDRLNVDNSRRNVDYVEVGSDGNYGKDANSKKHPIPISRIPIRKKNASE